jgi:hypothetical protein
VVTQLRAFLAKPGEIRVVYLQGLTGGPDSAGLAAVFVRAKAGQLRVIGLGRAN